MTKNKKKNEVRNIEDLKRDVQSLGRDVEDCNRDIRDLKRYVAKWWATPILVTLAILTFFGLWGWHGLTSFQKKFMVEAEKRLKKQVEALYEEKNVARVVEEVIKYDANDLIRKKVEIEIDPIVKDLKQKQEEHSKVLSYFRKEQEKLAQEVDYLRNRNEVLRLSDEAIATGNAATFEQLENIYDSSTDENIKKSALSEMFRVKNNFATMTRIKGIDVKYTHPKTGKVFVEKEIPTEALIQGLKNSKIWKYRAKIAQLLKERKEKRVPEALLEALKNDKNLEVRKKALDSFESVTGFTSRDVFKYAPAKKWWEENKQNVEKDLKDLQTIEKVRKKNSEN